MVMSWTQKRLVRWVRAQTTPSRILKRRRRLPHPREVRLDEVGGISGGIGRRMEGSDRWSHI